MIRNLYTYQKIFLNTVNLLKSQSSLWITSPPPILRLRLRLGCFISIPVDHAYSRYVRSTIKVANGHQKTGSHLSVFLHLYFVKALHLVKKPDCKRAAFVNLKYVLKDIFNRGLSFLCITSLLTSLNK